MMSIAAPGARRLSPLPPSHMGQGIRRETVRHVRHHHRQGPSDGAWAAAVLCRRDPPAAQQSLARLEKNHAKGTARTIRAQQLARAVSHRLTRQVAFEREMGFRGKGGERRSLGPHWTPMGCPCTRRVRVLDALRPRTPRRLGGPETLRPALGLDLRSRSWFVRRSSPTVSVGCASPAPGAHGTTRRVAPALCRGRKEGTDKLRGRSARHRRVPARVAQAARAPQDVSGAATEGLRRHTEITSEHQTVC